MAVFTGNGSAASPSLTFSSDTNTGIYRYGADILGITAGGVNTAAFASSGKLSLFTQATGEVVQITSTNTFNNASNNTAYIRFYDTAGAQGYIGYGGTQATFNISGAASQTVNINSNTQTTFTNGGITGARFVANTFTGGTNHLEAGSAGGNYSITGAYAGTGTDLAGGTLALFSGRGTGNSTASLQFYTWQQQASGTTTQPAQLAGGFYQTGVASGNVFRLASASQGIQFNGDTAAANALDDYEEGTWTPQSTAGVLVDNTGSYIKVGKQSILTYEFRVDPTTVTTSIIRILYPYNATSALSAKGVLTYCSANADAAGPYQWTNATTTYIDLVKNDGTAVSHAALAGDYFKGFFILG